MTTITDIVGAFAPESLERYPNLPPSHQPVISAIQNCRGGHYGHSLSQCQNCGGQHRVNHSCGNRHCPQCQHHKTYPGSVSDLHFGSHVCHPDTFS
jgi:hypothetical protein